MKKFIGITFLLGMAVIVLNSCNELWKDPSKENATGHVTVKITDAPFPADFVEAALVTIDRVELRKAGSKCPGSPVTAQNGNKGNAKGNAHAYKHSYGDLEFDCDSGFVTIATDSVELNLFELRNGVTEILANAELPVGEYDMIRLHVVDATIVLDDGTSFPMKVPSGNTSGLKIKLSPSLVVNDSEETEILVDFDLSRSFIVKGNAKSKKGIQGFIFKPVIRAVQESQAGLLRGFVYEGDEIPVPGATVSVILGNDTITSAITSEIGTYKILGLPAGTYNVVCEKEGYAKQETAGVVITERKSTTQNILLVKNP